MSNRVHDTLSRDNSQQSPYASVPAELKNLPHWARYRGGDKQPLHLDEYPMKWSIRSNWLTFDEVACYPQIGYFHTLESGIVGVDFDGCVDENGTIHPLVLERMGHTYAEFSPSTRGIKAYFRGSIPNGKAIINTDVPWRDPAKDPKEDHTGIEIYAQKRFFTVTGNVVPGCPSEINEVPEILHDIIVHFAPAPEPPKKKEYDLPQTKGYWSLNEWKAWCYKHLDMVEDLGDSLIIVCPWCEEHTTKGDTCRVWYGTPHTFNCFHAHCDGHKWRDVRLKHEPTAYDKRDPWADTATYVPGQDHSSNGNGSNGQGLDEIILRGQLREIRDQALASLGKSEESEPAIFVQSGSLVQIGRDKEHRAVIMHMGVSEMKNALTKAADFFSLRKKGDDYYPVPASPPKEIAEAILALSPSEWPFKPLEAIVETPVIRSDGTILQDPGYDDLTKLYYAPHKNMQECNVPESPTKKEAQEALAVLQDIIADFPFVGEPDYANTLALMITPIIRPAIKRHVPLALIDAPKQGAGKGLLSDATSIIATGESASILTAPSHEDEWRKQITSILMSGSTIVTIDNLPGRLQSSKLDAVLTSDFWKDRLLGGNTMVKVPQRATWIATGNNIKVGGDLARRCYRIRIDPQTSKPWNRAGFKYEDLATHVKEHRAQIITAILTLVRAWFVAGCPIDQTIPALGTFTGWARMVGSILKNVGVNGFLGNLDKLYDEMDEENAQWALFLQAWKDTFVDRAVFVKELVEALTKENEEVKQETFDELGNNDTGGDENFTGGCLADFLPESLQEALQPSTKEKKKVQKSFSVTLGKQLEKRVDTCFGENNLKLHRERDKKTNTTKWSVVTGGVGGEYNPSAKTRQSFSSSEESTNEKNSAKCSDGSDNLRHLRHLRQEESNPDGTNGTNQGEKTTEPLNSDSQEGLFSDTPPVNSEQPPVNLDALPDMVRRLYVDLIGSSFNERPSTIYRGEYMPLSDFYNRLVADLASSNEVISQTALAILQKKLAEVVA